jgi:hypothetical protein
VQLNKVGIGLIAFFGIAGALFVIVPIALGVPGMVVSILALLGGIWVVVALGLLWFARRQKEKGEHQDHVFRTGIRGTATVVSAGSNVTVNEMPRMKLKLALEVPGFPDRQVERAEIMPVFAARRMQPGLRLPVYVNPDDQDDLVLVW